MDKVGCGIVFMVFFIGIFFLTVGFIRPAWW